MRQKTRARSYPIPIKPPRISVTAAQVPSRHFVSARTYIRFMTHGTNGIGGPPVPKFVHAAPGGFLSKIAPKTGSVSGDGLSGDRHLGDSLGNHDDVLVATGPPRQRLAPQLQRVTHELVAQAESVKPVG
jgi:hypothetical protein